MSNRPPLISWLALGLAVLVLHAAGAVLPAPPLGSPSAWASWMVGRDPVAVAFGVVRLVALGAAWYGVAVTAVGVGLRLVKARTLAALVDRVTAAPLRRLVAATVTVGISVSPLAVRGAGAVTPAPTTTVVGTAPTPAEPPATVVTMHRLGTADTPPPAPEPSAGVPVPRDPTPPDPAAPTARATTWTVQPGQCFWSIAEAELARAWQRQPTAAEIVPYWRRLIEANRGVLADPHNADLVFPGQVFALPPP